MKYMVYVLSIFMLSISYAQPIDEFILYTTASAIQRNDVTRTQTLFKTYCLNADSTHTDIPFIVFGVTHKAYDTTKFLLDKGANPNVSHNERRLIYWTALAVECYLLNKKIDDAKSMHKIYLLFYENPRIPYEDKVGSQEVIKRAREATGIYDN